MGYDNWPKPPIWPEDLPLIRELLTEEEYAELLRRMVQVLPNGPLLDYRQAFGERELKAPNAARTLRASWLRYVLEAHRQPEPEPSVTLGRDAHAELVERDFLPTVGVEESTDDGSEQQSSSGTSSYDETPETWTFRAIATRVVSESKPNSTKSDRADQGTYEGVRLPTPMYLKLRQGREREYQS